MAIYLHGHLLLNGIVLLPLLLVANLYFYIRINQICLKDPFFLFDQFLMKIFHTISKSMLKPISFNASIMVMVRRSLPPPAFRSSCIILTDFPIVLVIQKDILTTILK